MAVSPLSMEVYVSKVLKGAIFFTTVAPGCFMPLFQTCSKDQAWVAHYGPKMQNEPLPQFSIHALQAHCGTHTFRVPSDSLLFFPSSSRLCPPKFYSLISSRAAIPFPKKLFIVKMETSGSGTGSLKRAENVLDLSYLVLT